MALNPFGVSIRRKRSRLRGVWSATRRRVASWGKSAELPSDVRAQYEKLGKEELAER